MAERFSNFEQAVIEMLLAGDHPSLEVLHSQLEESEFTRELTGAGFYLNFVVPDRCQTVTPPEFRVGDVDAKVKGLDYGAGFVLFVENGRLKVLEGYSYEEPWPDNIEEFTLSYSNEKRDLPF